MINFLSSPLWFSHFRSLPVILSSNCPSLCSLFLNSLPTYNNLLFDLPFPLISSWPTFCIFLLMPIPSFSNYFFSSFIFYYSLSLFFYLLCHLWCYCLSSLFTSTVFFHRSRAHLGCHINSMLCNLRYVFEPASTLFLLSHVIFSQWSHFLHFPTLFTTSSFTLHSCLSSLCLTTPQSLLLMLFSDYWCQNSQDSSHQFSLK